MEDKVKEMILIIIKTLFILNGVTSLIWAVKFAQRFMVTSNNKNLNKIIKWLVLLFLWGVIYLVTYLFLILIIALNLMCLQFIEGVL